MVAVVGAGGKTTLVFGLGWELFRSGSKVVVTTTTKLGVDQVEQAGAACRSADPAAVADALSATGPVMLVAEVDDRKATGPSPAALDELFRSRAVDHVLVEADGARRKLFKAPDSHEPVIPSAATMVVPVMGIDAVGRTIAEVCHRPERVADLAGLRPQDTLDAAACVRVLAHPDGGLKDVPAASRVVIAITRVTPGSASDAADEIADGLARHSRIDRVVQLPHPGRSL